MVEQTKTNPAPVGVDRCPETGKYLAGKNRRAHVMSVWHVDPEHIHRLQNPLARGRAKLVLGMPLDKTEESEVQKHPSAFDVVEADVE